MKRKKHIVANLNLISEEICYDVEFFSEASKGGKKEFYIEGIFAQADKKNRNGRVYPSTILMPEAEKFIETKVQKNLAMGELDHPKDFSVSMQKVSHLITDMEIKNSNVIGKAKIAHTPMGEIAKGLMETGAQLSVSTRGAGKSKKTSGYDEITAFMLSTIDIVSYPSAPEAFVNGINESVEYFVENGILQKSKADKIIRNKDLNELIRELISGTKIDTKGII